MDGPAGFNLEKIDRLRQMLGGSTLEALFDAFQADLAAGLIEIHACLGRNDAAGIGAISHGLQGASGNVGAAGIQDAATRLTAAIRDRRDPQSAVALLESRAASVGDFIRTLKAGGPDGV